MTVKNRMEMTQQSLKALIAAKGDYKILITDNGSDKQTLEYLKQVKAQKIVDRIIFNTNVPQWQKCFAIVQAVELLKNEKYDYFAWIDNDIVVKPEWDKAGIAGLDAGYKVSALCCDNTQIKYHGTGRECNHNGFKFYARASANGALWVVPKNFFTEFGLPPVNKGINRQGTEDWYYTDQFRHRGINEGFATFNTHSEHIGKALSEKGRVLRGVSK